MSTDVLWTAEEAARATGGKTGRTWAATGVSIDSRTVRPGDLFVALAGPRFDGHDFVAAALQAGAVAAMVSRRPDGIATTAPLLRVRDSEAGLDGLGRAARARTDARIAGVTGSVGKTGVKDALAAVLGAQGPTHATTGNLNNQWGVPLTLARMPSDTRWGVIEMGMNHAGELGPLARLVRPRVAIITTIAAVHLEHFESVSAIAAAKAEIFEGFEGTEGGVAVLHRDNPYFAMLSVAAMAAGAARVIGFGAHPDAEARLIEAAPDPAATRVRARICGRDIEYMVGIPGRHWAINSLAVLASAQAMGADLAAGAETLATLSAPAGRGQRIRIAVGRGAIDLIDDSYNASPASMRAALDLLSTVDPPRRGRRVAVLGDMLELGPRSDELHMALVPAIVAGRVSKVFTAGPHMERLFEALPKRLRGAHTEESRVLAGIVAGAVRAGDVVLVKGSRGSRMDRVVKALQAVDDGPARAANGE